MSQPIFSLGGPTAAPTAAATAVVPYKKPTAISTALANSVKPTLDGIPYKLKAQIASFLSVKEMRNMRGVCREMPEIKHGLLVQRSSAFSFSRTYSFDYPSTSTGNYSVTWFAKEGEAKFKKWADGEGMDYAKMTLYKQRAFNKHRAAKPAFGNPIPTQTFHFWLTPPNKPKELNAQFVKWIKTFPAKNLVVEGWRHYLVVLDKTKLPQTAHQLAGTGIQIKDIKEFLRDGKLSTPILNYWFYRLVALEQWGPASDLIRADFMHEFGGIYADMDTCCFHSFTPLTTRYFGFISADPWSPWIANHAFGFAPHHPMMLVYLRTIEDNLERPTRYLRDTRDDNFWHTIFATGPAAFGAAFYKACQQDKDTGVMVLPSEYIYPVADDKLGTLKPEALNVDPMTILAHYCTMSWVKKKGED